jgi:hypothetical protein
LSQGSVFEDWIRDHVEGAGEISPLNTNASRRLFYRVSTSAGPLVAMDSGRIPMDSWVDVNHLLASRGMPVPRILHCDIPAGWAVMEDMGDTRVLDLSAEEYEEALGACLDLLDRMQRDLTLSSCAESIAGRRYFTASFFAAELDHTLEHLFFRLLAVPPERVSRLQEHFRDLCGLAAEGPRVFTHRDFHSANLMWHGGGPVMLDWQDARFGPPDYDLVSLLRDSYRDAGPAWETQSKRFLQQTGRSSMFRLAACACQRSLKAAGTFAYQYRAFERVDYLGSLPRTLRYLADYSRLCPRLEPLVRDVYEVLDTHRGEIDLSRFRESDAPVITG